MDAVKIEGGMSRVETVRKLVSGGVAVMGKLFLILSDKFISINNYVCMCVILRPCWIDPSGNISSGRVSRPGFAIVCCVLLMVNQLCLL